MSDGLARVTESVAECPVCVRYLTRLAAAIQNPGVNPPPSTARQVEHEKEAHGSPAAYYRQIQRSRRAG